MPRGLSFSGDGPEVRARFVNAAAMLGLERHRGSLTVLALTFVVCFAVMLGGAALGSISLPFGTVLSALVHPNVTSDAGRILWDLRFARVLLAALVGAALGISGMLLQTMLRNPLVDPYLTGTSAGAACAVAIGIAAGVAAPALPLLAFLAALGTAALVATLARTGAGISTERLILAGVSLSALFGGIVTLVILLAPSQSMTLSILGWLGGSLAGRGWPDLRIASIYAAVGTIAAFALAPALNALRLGERRARALGVDVDRVQWAIVGSAALLTAAAVSVSGIVGFVGLIVPHVVRRLVGSDARLALPASALVGAMFVVGADTLARSIVPPVELPLGVLLSMVGVPAFIYLAFRRRAV
jgi:iron complex transport system permease protein